MTRTKRWRWLAMAGLLLGVDLILFLLPAVRYDEIVVHHTASTRDDLSSIRRLHLRRGWSDTAYHLVLSNGSVGVPEGYLEASSRYRWGLWSVATKSKVHNLRGLHLAVVGNYEEGPIPEDLQRALGSTLHLLREKWGIAADRVILHRDCSATACPGKNVTRRVLQELQSRAGTAPKVDLAADVREQQRGVVASGWWLGNFRTAGLALNGLVGFVGLVHLAGRRSSRLDTSRLDCCNPR